MHAPRESAKLCPQTIEMNLGRIHAVESLGINILDYIEKNCIQCI